MLNRVARTAVRVVVLLAVLYGVLVGIGLLLTKVFERSALIREEAELNEALAEDRTSTLNDVTYLLSGLGNTAAIIAALLVVAVGLRLATKKWTLSVFLVLAVSAQALVFLLVTLAISRKRPDVRQLDDSPPTSSFPSGHTGAATALFVASALLVLWYVQRRWVKILSVTLLLAVPLLVAYGRLYRGMHHPTDIAGAYLNGLACITIAATSVLGRGWRRGDRSPDPSGAPRTAVGAAGTR
ncbi:MAG: phosphatase PAP2 family protein [Actinomycetes bacterium]